ncbi:MAG: NADH-quinone oxidoreductase subunit A [Anaerolineaceae bacterium]
MAQPWILVAFFLIIAPLLPAAGIFLAGLLAPKKPNPIKNSTYECGIEVVGENWIQFKSHYYIFTLIYLVFDVEVVFLFPWAVAYSLLPIYAIIEGILFVAILAAGLIYAWEKGVLVWH